MLAHRTFLLALGTSLAVAMPGCVLDDPTLDGLRCPCVVGYVCDVATSRCVREGAGSDAEVPVDGGLADGGAADAPIELDAGPPVPTCVRYPDAIFCEDFEADERVRWTEVSAVDGTIAWDPEAAKGSGVGLRIDAPSSSSIIRMTASIDTSGMSTVYFHAWVRVRSASGPIDLFQLTAPGGGTISAGRLPTGQYVVELADEAGTRSDTGRETAWMLGAWTCVNVEVVRADAGSVTVLGLGGGANVTSVAADTDWGASYDAFSIAFGVVGAAIDVDDVIWTRGAPVDCP